MDLVEMNNFNAAIDGQDGILCYLNLILTQSSVKIKFFNQKGEIN